MITAAYVTTYSASDLRGFSGSGYYIFRALQDAGLRTESIGALRDIYAPYSRTKQFLYSRFLRRTYRPDREPLTLNSFARQVERSLDRVESDIVFSPGTIPIAYLRTNKPVVFWTDATFAGMTDFYPDFTNLCAKTVRDGNRMEQAALRNCSLAIYSSEWAANTAIQYYDVDPAKVKVVPFGANLECSRTQDDIDLLARTKRLDSCKLLLVGVDWAKKGADVAVEVAEELRRQGLRTELNIVGCTAPRNLPDFVKVHGFVSKKSADGRRLLDRLYSESHFLILPSQAECCAVVLAEASSFGLPSLATNVGGNSTAIHDGKNGQTFGLDAGPAQYCDYILELMSSKKAYAQLAISSFGEYSARLNWAYAGERVRELLAEQVGHA